MNLRTMRNIILGLVVLIATAGISIAASNKMGDYTSQIDEKTTSVSVKRDSIELGKIDEKNKDYILEADFGNIKIKDVKMLSLQMDPQWPKSDADIISWSAYCHKDDVDDIGYVELFDAPVEIGEVTSSGEMEAIILGMLESNGYQTEIECDHIIDIHISIGDNFFFGKGATFKLFYEADR